MNKQFGKITNVWLVSRLSVGCKRDDICGIVEWDNNRASGNETVTGGSGRGLLYVLFSTFPIVTEKRRNYGRLWTDFRLWILVNRQICC